MRVWGQSRTAWNKSREVESWYQQSLSLWSPSCWINTSLWRGSCGLSWPQIEKEASEWLIYSFNKYLTSHTWSLRRHWVGRLGGKSVKQPTLSFGSGGLLLSWAQRIKARVRLWAPHGVCLRFPLPLPLPRHVHTLSLSQINLEKKKEGALSKLV